MTYILDRFEEAFALLEDENGTVVQVPKSQLPKDAAEGSVLRQEQDGWVPDEEKTKARAAAIKSKMDLLWQ